LQYVKRDKGSTDEEQLTENKHKEEGPKLALPDPAEILRVVPTSTQHGANKIHRLLDGK
jgi:hypothetical protein